MTERIRTVRVEEFEDFMRVLERSYGCARGWFGRHYPHIYRADPEACDCFHIVERDGEIVSHVGVYPIDVVVAGVSIPIGGIGGVGTLPEQRGKGYMSRLLCHAIRVMREKGWPVSGLGGDRQRYNTFGWEWAGLAYRLTFSRRSLDRAGVEAVSIEEKMPGEAVQTMERLQAHGVCHARRPNLGLQLRRDGLRLWVAEDGYAIVAEGGEKGLSVLELVSASGKETGMIRTMLDCTFGSEAMWRLSSWEQERLARILPCVSAWSPECDWMYRIMSLSGLLTACKPVLERRAAGLHDFDVAIGIREDDQIQVATVAVRNGTVEITPERASEAYVELDPMSAARLFLGGPAETVRKEIPAGLAALLPVPIHVPELDHV